MILLLETRIPIVLYYLLDVQFIRNDHLQNFFSNYRVQDTKTDRILLVDISLRFQIISDTCLAESQMSRG